MASTIIIGILLFVILITAMIALGYRRQTKRIESEYRKLLAVYNEAITLAEAGQSTAKDFLNACRLIAIHRSGRMNHFTFVRGNETFTIQTMGLMSDVPDVWRKWAGLD